MNGAHPLASSAAATSTPSLFITASGAHATGVRRRGREGALKNREKLLRPPAAQGESILRGQVVDTHPGEHLLVEKLAGVVRRQFEPGHRHPRVGYLRPVQFSFAYGKLSRS